MKVRINMTKIRKISIYKNFPAFPYFFHFHISGLSFLEEPVVSKRVRSYSLNDVCECMTKDIFLTIVTSCYVT